MTHDLQPAIERALCQITLRADERLRTTEDVRAALRECGLPDPELAYLEEAGLDRLLTYRRLIRGNLREAITTIMPRATARLGSVFEESFDAFLAQQGPHSRYLRDVCREFLGHALPRWQRDRRVPAYLGELAEHELLRIEVSARQAQESADPQATPADLSLQGGARFIEAAELAFYQHAIHELSDDEDDRAPPRREPTWLLVYRSPEHDVCYLKLSELAFGILHRLLDEHAPLGEAVQQATAELGHELSESVITGTADLLSDLTTRGVLLGPTWP